MDQQSTLQDTSFIKQDDQIVLFDATCILCSRWVHFLLARDHRARLSFCSAQSPEGQTLLKSQGMDVKAMDTLLYWQEGKIYQRSAAVLKIIGQLGYPWALLSGLKLIPTPLRDRLYHWIATNRYRFFGQRDQCLVPTENHRSRFIEYRDKD